MQTATGKQIKLKKDGRKVMGVKQVNSEHDKSDPRIF